MVCELCRKDAPLYKGLHDNRVILVCGTCANMEGILIINKPTKEQLEKAQKRETVRQTMERLSGNFAKRPIANIDHDISERNLEKIKIVPKAQHVEQLKENYDWEIRMARRRKKMTAKDLAKATGISVENIDRIEKGYLTKDYPLIISAIEKALEIQLTTESSPAKIKFNFPKKEEKIDVEKIKQDMQREAEKRKEMQAKTTLDLSKHKIEEKRLQIETPQIQKTRTQIAMERLHTKDKPRRFEKKELKDVRLSDLTDRKIAREKEEIIGDEIEFEE